MKQGSPFAYGRFEKKTGKPSYFLHRDIYHEVVRDAPTTIYLVGPRGTGKTTLLKALDWRERLENPTLRAALDGDVFTSPSGNFLGVYLKLPEILMGVVEKWLESLDEERSGSVLGLYLDLVWIEAVCIAISELLALEIFDADPQQEQRAVAKITTRYGKTFTRDSRRAPRTLAELASAILGLRVEIEQSAKTRVPHATILGLDAVAEIGGFGRYVGEALEPLCRGKQGEQPWHFRICMDEAETMSRFQLLVLNSMVRVARTPIFFLASFVSMPKEIYLTLFENLTLSAADREIVSFENLVTKKRFREFAEGVATVRVREVLPDGTFALLRSLGPLNINGLLQRILERSASPSSKTLLAKAEALAQDPRFVIAAGPSEVVEDEDAEGNANELDEADDFDSIEDFEELEQYAPDTLPIYQAFLIDELHIELPSEDAPWKRRRQSSAQLRKRMVASYLAICRRVSTKPRYASAQMVLRLSDLCIRDFLRFLDYVYRHSRGDLSEFLGGQVGADIQDEAIKEASKTKAEGVDASAVSSPREIGMMVRGLGRVTRILQTRSRNEQHLRSSERGIFRLRITRAAERDSKIYRQINEAAEAGFLRLKETKEDIRFRLHASLAPAYELSYRGAYYRSPVNWTDMERLAGARTDTEIDALAETIGRRLAGVEVLPLFAHMEDEQDV